MFICGLPASNSPRGSERLRFRRMSLRLPNILAEPLRARRSEKRSAFRQSDAWVYTLESEGAALFRPTTAELIGGKSCGTGYG